MGAAPCDASNAYLTLPELGWRSAASSEEEPRPAATSEDRSPLSVVHRRGKNRNQNAGSSVEVSLWKIVDAASDTSSMQAAAEKLNISVTSLKRRCRLFGVKRWQDLHVEEDRAKLLARCAAEMLPSVTDMQPDGLSGGPQPKLRADSEQKKANPPQSQGETPISFAAPSGSSVPAASPTTHALGSLHGPSHLGGQRVGTRLGRVEEQWFGAVQGGSLQERLERLEVAVFGQHNVGSAPARLDWLENAL